MNVKCLHLRAIRNDKVAVLMRLVWRNLESDSPVTAFSELRTLDKAWLSDFKEGQEFSCQGVRLKLRSITFMQHPDQAYWQVRIEFYRMDALERLWQRTNERGLLPGFFTNEARPSAMRRARQAA